MRRITPAGRCLHSVLVLVALANAKVHAVSEPFDGAQPSAVEQRTQVRPEPRIEPRGQPAHDSNVPPPAQVDPSAAQPQSTFDIFEIRVRGNHVLQPKDIEPAVLPHLGPRRTIKDVEAARRDLEKVYHDRGFQTVYVDIPQQRVTGGVVILKVTEVSVKRLRVVGSRYFSLGYIKQAIPSLGEGNVPNFNDVQKELAQLNRSTDRNVTPILKPSSTPGQMDVELKVKDQFPLHGSVEVNDRYSLNTTHTRAVAQLRYDNLWQRGHSINLLYQVAPERPSDADVRSVSYVIPGDTGRTYAMYAIRSRSDVAAVGTLNVIGKGDIFGVRLIQPLPSVDALTQSINLGVDYKDLTEDVNLVGGGTFSSPITYVPVSATYSGTLAGARGTTSFDAGATFVIRGLGGNANDFNNSRANADSAFVAFRGGVQRAQVLPAKWSLLAKLDGQLASGPLVNSEEFAAGGALSVRGYKEAEVLGDNGIHGSLELRTPSLWNGDKPGDRNLLFLAFVEGAHLRVRQPLPGQQADFTLASAGLGLRVQARGLGLTLDAAHAFKDAVNNGVSGNTSAGDNRLHFAVSYEF